VAAVWQKAFLSVLEERTTQLQAVCRTLAAQAQRKGEREQKKKGEKGAAIADVEAAAYGVLACLDVIGGLSSPSLRPGTRVQLTAMDGGSTKAPNVAAGCGVAAVASGVVVSVTSSPPSFAASAFNGTGSLCPGSLIDGASNGGSIVRARLLQDLDAAEAAMLAAAAAQQQPQSTAAAEQYGATVAAPQAAAAAQQQHHGEGQEEEEEEEAEQDGAVVFETALPGADLLAVTSLPPPPGLLKRLASASSSPPLLSSLLDAMPSLRTAVAAAMAAAAVNANGNGNVNNSSSNAAAASAALLATRLLRKVLLVVYALLHVSSSSTVAAQEREGAEEEEEEDEEERQKALSGLLVRAKGELVQLLQTLGVAAGFPAHQKQSFLSETSRLYQEALAIAYRFPEKEGQLVKALLPPRELPETEKEVLGKI